MQKNFLKEGLILGVIILFVGAGFVPSVIGNGSVLEHRFYVDGDNIDGPWDGTPEHPYQHIQDAIDNASEGDIVYVYSGTYYENVVIDKSIILEGEDKIQTVIDGQGTSNVVEIRGEANHATIKTINITNSGKYKFDAGIDIRKLSEKNTDGVSISNAFIYNCAVGILAEEECWGVKISYNLIQHCHQGITLLSGCRHGEITENNISDIGLTEVSLENRQAFGIFLYKSGDVTVKFNEIKDVRHWGINIETHLGDPETDEPLGNVISYNKIEDCLRYGLVVFFSDKNTILKNDFINNNLGDLVIYRAYDNEIRENKFHDCDSFIDFNHISLISTYGFNTIENNVYDKFMPFIIHWDFRHEPINEPDNILNPLAWIKYIRGKLFSYYAIVEWS